VTTSNTAPARIALIEAGSPGLNIYSHVAMGRGAALLATVLADAGYDARAFIEDISGKDSIDWDYVSECDVIGFSTITCTMPRTVELLAQARAQNPDAVVVFGGPESTCEPQRSLDAGAEFVLRGEAEQTLPRLVSALRASEHSLLATIHGLVWREGETLRFGPDPQQLTRDELDALPLLDHSLVHGARASVAPVWRARGCPQRCDFCEVCEIWPRYVRRDEHRSVEELVRAQEDGYSAAFLIDDNAAANKPAFKAFLREAAERGFARMLVTQIRADSVFTREGKLDRELLRLLKKAASVTVVCVGVESADDANLERLHKRIDNSRMAKGLRAMRRRGLLVHGMFIALNEDSKEIIHRNGQYAKRCVSSLQYLFETPLPGTKRTEEHTRKGAFLFDRLEDLSLYDGMHVVLRPLKMAPAEMQALVGREYRRFYSRRRTVAAALKGTFFRYRRLSGAQRAFLDRLRLRDRIRWWARFHVEYKYAPTSFLAIGRRRIREFMADQEYQAYTARLKSSGGNATVTRAVERAGGVDPPSSPR
jgi:radical SAM superfamily enzyme YgiQ (UPF0313 family)